jgi:BirA family biotin operon repressor/biotin-[acetyl-CoA-carboxylase] ligase
MSLFCKIEISPVGKVKISSLKGTATSKADYTVSEVLQYNEVVDAQSLQAALIELPIPEFRYYTSVGSTNDVAATWAAQGAPDLALVIADEQTAGRGRAGRRWHTPLGAALAFSLVLHPPSDLADSSAHLTALGALAVSEALRQHYQLPAQIKWPNDVLLNGKKICGVLVEASWRGPRLESAVLGIGVNVAPMALPPPEISLTIPATSVEDQLGRAVERAQLLGQILSSLIAWRPHLGSTQFVQAWKLHLAYLYEQVQIYQNQAPVCAGQIIGLAPSGALQIRLADGTVQEVKFGELRLRPV